MLDYCCLPDGGLLLFILLDSIIYKKRICTPRFFSKGSNADVRFKGTIRLVKADPYILYAKGYPRFVGYAKVKVIRLSVSAFYLNPKTRGFLFSTVLLVVTMKNYNHLIHQGRVRRNYLCNSSFCFRN